MHQMRMCENAHTEAIWCSFPSAAVIKCSDQSGGCLVCAVCQVCQWMVSPLTLPRPPGVGSTSSLTHNYGSGLSTWLNSHQKGLVSHTSGWVWKVISRGDWLGMGESTLNVNNSIAREPRCNKKKGGNRKLKPGLYALLFFEPHRVKTPFCCRLPALRCPEMHGTWAAWLSLIKVVVSGVLF